LKRLGKVQARPKFDKECGNSYISEGKECHIGKGSGKKSKQKSEKRPKELSHGQRLAGYLIGAAIIVGFEYLSFKQAQKNRAAQKKQAEERWKQYGGQRQAYQNWYENYYKAAAPKKEPWHEVLRVSPKATPQEVKSAFRKLAKETHPDTAKDKDSHERFLKVSSAWEDYVNQHGRKDSLPRRFRADAGIPRTLEPQIVSTLRTAYGNGVLGVVQSKISKDGVVEGIFLGRSRPNVAPRPYRYSIDLVNERIRFRRRDVRRDSEGDCDCEDKKRCSCAKCSAA
jgi:hypothetical protein